MENPNRARLFRPLLAVLLVMALVAACTSTGGETTTTPAGTGGPTTTPGGTGGTTTTTPDAGGGQVLVVNQVFAHTSADPHRERTAHGRTVLRPVYETLTHFDSPDVSEPKPLLAESWSSNDDATVWTFIIRDGAVFSNGDPLTADDVVFSLNRFKNMASAFAFLLTDIEVTLGANDREVVLTSPTTNVAIPFLVSYPHMAVVNADLVRANGGTDGEDASTADTAEEFFAEQSVGSGPYTFGTFSTTTTVEYIRNDNYWGDESAFERIVYVNAHPQTALLNVQLGRADLILDVTDDSLSALDPSGLDIVQGPSPIVWYLFLNMDPSVSTTASSRDIYEAVRYGLDYEALSELYGPAAIQSCGIVPRTVLGSLGETECISQDVARAEAALTRSGIENPTVEFEFISDFNIEGVSVGTVAERIQAQMAEIGITLNLRASPIGTQLQRYASRTTEGHLWSISMRHPDVSSYVQALTFGANALATGWEAADMSAIEDIGTEILTSTSDDHREPLVQEWQRMLNEDGPYVTLFQGTRTLVGKDSLEGVESHPLYFVDFLRIRP